MRLRSVLASRVFPLSGMPVPPFQRIRGLTNFVPGITSGRFITPAEGRKQKRP